MSGDIGAVRKSSAISGGDGDGSDGNTVLDSSKVAAAAVVV